MGFEETFRALDMAHRPPLKWQTRLHSTLKTTGVPRACTLPTGLGKTSVISIWLIALAGGANLPRRLVYIVNRRTVVDQATDVATAMRDRLLAPNDERWRAHRDALLELSHQLRRLSASEDSEAPLAVSTLRGELADNGEWKDNPARPAIIIGTIDMIGSKLLFSGYGDGRYGRAHHAGLIGQDAFIVHDEAHLEPAFDALLRSVAAEQARCGESRPICVMSLSATTREGGTGSNGATDAGSPFSIENEDRREPVVSQRLGARKSLTIVDAERGRVFTKIAEEALKLGASPARVLVYVRSPDDVAKIAEVIEKKTGDGGGSRIARLTGTIRGKERDELAESDVFLAFNAGSGRSSPLPHSLYLVATSAGEVGADWDADHLVCDLSTLDSMAQRFGRVNRLGGKERSATITVVAEPVGDKVPLKAQIEAAARLLRTLPAIDGGFDASPAALAALLAKPEAQAAFSPVPTILPATDILFDHWSLTSLAGEMPGRPEVGPYLHGVADWEPPETHVAWRADIALLAGAGGVDARGEAVPCSKEDLVEVFEAFPLRSAETLRDRTDRVQAELRKIAERLRKEAEHRALSPPAGTADMDERSVTPGADEDEGEAAKKEVEPINPNPWVVLVRGGSAQWVRLEEIAPGDKDDAKRARLRLAFATVVLPVEAGGLKDGMLVGDEPPPRDAHSLDVAEVARQGAPERQRVIVKGEKSCGLLGGDIADGVTKTSVILASEDEDAEPERVEYRVARGQDHEPGQRVPLQRHHQLVSEAAERIGKALRLDDPLVTALRIAGEWHDAGKARAVWQRYANNWDATKGTPRDGQPIAKSDRYGHWKQLAGYRHEFGSLHDAAASCETGSLDADTRDLVLHLIAAHHGWARPHFEPRHFDPGDPLRAGGKPRPTADNERLAVETMQRFARLHQRYGRWHLAWLESILRCADALGSQSDPSRDREGAGFSDGAGVVPTSTPRAGANGGAA